MASDGMQTSRVVALTLVVGTFFTAQGVLIDLASGRPISVVRNVGVGLLFWVVWAFLTPLVVRAVQRLPLDAKPVYHPLLVHGAISAALAAAQTIITLGLRSLSLYASDAVGVTEALTRMFSRPALVWGVFTGVFFYWVMALTFTALRFRGLYAAERVSAAELASRSAALEAELTRSRLDALRSQLRPHFLFNTLNAISVLAAKDSEKTERMLLRLSSLLRRSLDEDSHEVSFRQELAFLNDYLDIQRVRFGDQLTVHLAIGDEVLDARIPVLLLQPLVENAIEHGESETGRTTITLRASRERDMLHVIVEDDGPGVADGAVQHEGVGLGNTRARLHHLYGPNASVALSEAQRSAPSPGTRVDIQIPFARIGA